MIPYLYSIVFSLFNNSNLGRNLNEFEEVKLTRNDTYNEKRYNEKRQKYPFLRQKNDYIWRVYYDNKNGNFLDNSYLEYPNFYPEVSNEKTRIHDENIAVNGIAYISYRISTGQIGLFFIRKEYQNCGIGKQILEHSIKDITNNYCDKIFVITTKNHPLWSNVYKRSFYWSSRPDESVEGSGYILDISRFSLFLLSSN